MRLDEAIKKCKNVAADFSSKEYEQLAKWLEELKDRRETDLNYVKFMDCRYRDGYGKAIDDFVKNINECSGWTPNCIESSHNICLTIYTLNQIAEHLKECIE